MDFSARERDSKDPKNCPFCPGNEAKTPNEVRCTGGTAAAQTARAGQSRGTEQVPALELKASWTKKAKVCRQNECIGAHEVIIESPDHSATLATLSNARWKMCCGRTVTGCWI